MIATERLELVPATVELARAALDGESALAACLGVVVPATWPPEFLDPPALEFTLDRLAEGPLPAVQRVIAETLPELTPSIGVLGKCGFRFIGDGAEPGVIRFELTRADFSIGKGAA